jgi:hypothetical protein
VIATRRNDRRNQRQRKVVHDMEIDPGDWQDRAKLGWLMGFEPTTTGITIEKRGS